MMSSSVRLLSKPAEATQQTITVREATCVQAEPGMFVEEKALARAVGLVRGDTDPGLFFDARALATIKKKFGGLPAAWRDAQGKKLAYAKEDDAPFPPAPTLREPAVIR
jgi:hypothetical protein